MANQTLLDVFTQNKQIEDWLTQGTTLERQLVMGLSGSSKSLAMAAYWQKNRSKLVILTATHHESEQLASDLSDLLGEDIVYQFFMDDALLGEFLLSSQEKSRSRLETLNFLLDPVAEGIVILSLAACRLPLPNPKVYQQSLLGLKLGQELAPIELSQQLINLGYEKVSQVSQLGQFSQRGDIFDIYDSQSDRAYRLEFFGDEIDGIRLFDSQSQKSLENLETILISPADEMILLDDDFDRCAQILENSSRSTPLSDYLEQVLLASQQRRRHEDFRQFLPYFYEKIWTILDYLPKETPIFFDDFQKLVDRHAKLDLDIAHYLTDRLQEGKALPSQTYLANSYQNLRHYQPATFFSNFHKGLGNIRFQKIYNLTQYPMQDFYHQLPLLVDELNRYQKNGATVILQLNTAKSLQELQATLQDYQVEVLVTSSQQIEKGIIQLLIGNLAQGFYFADEKLALLTEKEIFHKKIKRKIRRQHLSNAERLKDYNELETGDYVVHHVHGIGQFLGLETIEISGVHRDYLTIQYQNQDRISVPIDQIDSLSKYLSSDGKEPKLNKLNDGRFKKTKQKVVKQVEDIADDLLQLYAERSQLKGFAFSPDDTSQVDFDSDFAYAETDDQLRSIKEIKKDMEMDRPMDRLLVGDVGFGKTEVAMRAAFKAVNDGKQVAVLVPTTVLAQQHYVNFKERFSNFAVEVGVLSRFQTKKEQVDTLVKLSKGQVDIVIGTHRLLSKDVEFSDLGLLIIDEEQRFGVKHKERLKELKNKIDVLTLTATPIPRTLHMSMLGIRDLSVIETPPTNRYPVQTYVMETNPGLIREATLREIDRGGQVFYVYNRVDTLEQKVSELQDLIPEASIGFVHGQMSEIQLENTLLDFIDGAYDVLVATTIIETGVDIANVNTLFIENADYMGLSTLYQLRGRVGRSNRIAYAYLMYRPDKILTEVSEKRLEAIKGFTELGSGFKIAMRDLSIRGAGNLLGASQSGFIDSVGFELYSQLLEEALAKKQGQVKVRQKGNAELNLQIDAYIPQNYITDERQKIEVYKRIRELVNRLDYENLQDELIDRFGEYPDSVAYLLEIALIKSQLDQVFVEVVERQLDRLTVRFEKVIQSYFLTQDYFEALSKTKLKARISEYEGKIEVIFDIRNKKDYEILEELGKFGEACCDIKARKTTQSSQEG
ncbi:transcription-repair coupling factor [Streptococcus sp. sy010]|uniref:transcription-repair coupling factor n=1 Tax=Streptococcus sp. sy010 TaxID=2600148 RepID=UPI0011B5CAB7|nr:transcription-repair coupling factor [Streptococcus sp. sy010]TWT14373.1 transcription-repair coupling factor [Streptococcus sp. sy010]